MDEMKPMVRITTSDSGNGGANIHSMLYQVLEEKETELAFDKGSDRQVAGCQPENGKRMTYYLIWMQMQ